MLSKNELKYIQSLCHKKQREAEGLFLAEGTKLIDELLQSDYTVKKIYALEEWVDTHSSLKMPVQVVTQPELEKISLLQTPNQVLAVVEQAAAVPLHTPQNELIIVTDGIQDPGNFGTIIRIADWFGIRHIVASDDTVELYNPKVIQATMGSFLRVRVQYASLAEFLSTSKQPVFGALLNGNSLYEQSPVKEGILVIGNEAKGIRAGILSYITHPLTIPRVGGAESLNAAVATGILVSHLRSVTPQ